MQTNSAFIFAGTPGSGKTTYIKKHFSSGEKIFSIDKIKNNIFKSKHLKKELERFAGIETEYFYLNDEKYGKILHQFCIQKDLLNKEMNYFFRTIRKHKPTVVFDTTLRKMELFDQIYSCLKAARIQISKYSYNLNSLSIGTMHIEKQFQNVSQRRSGVN